MIGGGKQTVFYMPQVTVGGSEALKVSYKLFTVAFASDKTFRLLNLLLHGKIIVPRKGTRAFGTEYATAYAAFAVAVGATVGTT